MSAGGDTVPSRRSRQQERREASYEAVVRAAMEAFNERGFAATTVRQIMDRTRYTDGAFYFHFRNKTDCFWHVVEYRQSNMGDWSGFVADLPGPEELSLEGAVARTLGRMDDLVGSVNEWVLMVVDFYQQHRDDPEVLERLREVYRRWGEEPVSFVRALQRRGWVDSGRDPVVIASQLIAIWDGFVISRRIHGLDRDTAAVAMQDAMVRVLR